MLALRLNYKKLDNDHTNLKNIFSTNHFNFGK